MEWKPIATAPRDGSIFLAFYVGGFGSPVGPMRWSHKKPRGFDSHSMLTESARATHWMPLPDPPLPQQESQ